MQAFADELQARSEQVNGIAGEASARVEEVGGALHQRSREMTLAVDRAAKLLSEVTSGLQTHTVQLTQASETAVEQTQAMSEQLIEGASRLTGITENSTALIGDPLNPSANS